MSAPLADPEPHRVAVLRQISELEDLCAGSIPVAAAIVRVATASTIRVIARIREQNRHSGTSPRPRSSARPNGRSRPFAAVANWSDASSRVDESICRAWPAGSRFAETDYFERNAERMRHPKFGLRHLFVGAGAIRGRLHSRRFHAENPVCSGAFAAPTR